MGLTAGDILDRTARLINVDCFNAELRAEDIVAGLLSTTVLAVATEEILSSQAGQSALVSFVTLTARMGVGVDLDIPDVPVLGAQPPLRSGDPLRAALHEHAGSLVPSARFDAGGTPHAVYEFGPTGRLSAQGVAGARVTSVTWDATGCRVGPVGVVGPQPSKCEWPIGALAAGGAACSEVFRLAVDRIAQQTKRALPTVIRPHGVDVIAVRLGPEPIANPDVGVIDIISAGAITHAALFALLRIPDLAGAARVFDDDQVEDTNLNRYQLLRAQDIGVQKVRLLERFSTPTFSITGVPQRYVGGVPLAKRVLVGADDIPTRWLVQSQSPAWLGVGATGHLLAVVSTHEPAGPCAGCVHDHDDDIAVGEPIPTASVVSFWAGLLMAAELLKSVGGTTKPGQHVMCFPIGLGGRGAYLTNRVVANRRCPVGCEASHQFVV